MTPKRVHPAGAAVLAGLLLWTLPAAGHAQAAPAAASSIEQGRVLAARNCGMCHATEPFGPSADPRAPPFRDLHNRLEMKRLGEATTKGILATHPAMPEFRFEPDELISIILYLWSIQSKQYAQAPPARPARP